jgi:predicted  nucleic acid-binding Zn-ribbon protein
MAVNAQSLQTLHRLHRQLTDLRDRFERGPRQLKAREANLQKLLDELAKIQAESKAAKMRADQKQLLLKSGEDKISSLEAKLMASQSNREYQALKDQIAADKMANSVLADEILEGLEKIDECKLVQQQADAKIAESKQDLAQAQQKVKADQELIAADIKRLEADLLVAEKDLPDDFREVYVRLVRSRGEDGMAEVEADTCMGCQVRLTPNLAAEISMQHTVICKSCGRLLYAAQ